MHSFSYILTHILDRKSLGVTYDRQTYPLRETLPPVVFFFIEPPLSGPLVESTRPFYNPPFLFSRGP